MSLVRVEERDGIAVVTLDRPPANAFAPELVDRMRDVLRETAGARALVLASAAPVIAALPGHAIAGGLIVACAADERYAAEGAARFGLSEVALGVPLPACCLELFAYVLGPRRMERLTASAENLPAAEALALGLLDRVVAAPGL